MNIYSTTSTTSLALEPTISFCNNYQQFSSSTSSLNRLKKPNSVLIPDSKLFQLHRHQSSALVVPPKSPSRFDSEERTKVQQAEEKRNSYLYTIMSPITPITPTTPTVEDIVQLFVTNELSSLDQCGNMLDTSFNTNINTNTNNFHQHTNSITPVSSLSSNTKQSQSPATSVSSDDIKLSSEPPKLRSTRSVVGKFRTLGKRITSYGSSGQRSVSSPSTASSNDYTYGK